INFIVDPRVRGQVNVVSGQPIKRDELYDLFLGVLKSYGFAAVTGADGTVRIVPEVQAKENEVGSLEQNSRGDEFITHVISVRHLDASQLVRILRPLVPKGGHLAGAAGACVGPGAGAHHRGAEHCQARGEWWHQAGAGNSR